MGGGEKGKVCVTGGTGYVASWLIMRLLQHGYSVRTTVRSLPLPEECAAGRKDISFLTSLPGASEKLKIFSADLDRPDSFGEAIEGCIGVFHVAHPVDFEGREAEEIVSERSVKGTLGILKACLNSGTVKRVVYTSSASTVVFNERPEDVLDESAWSDLDFVRALKSFASSYMVSKILTERAALEFSENEGLDLVTVIPSFIVGPFICPRIPGSVRSAMAMIFGNKDQYEHLMNTSMVHIDDVASAHIFLFEYPAAKGRYNCSSDRITIHGMSEFLSTKYPEFSIPTPDSLRDIKGYMTKGLSSKKLLDCGFKFNHGIDDMYDGAIQSCKEKGFL